MGPKLSVSLRVDLDRDDVLDRAINEFRYAWERNVHSTASPILSRENCFRLFLAETIQPHHFAAFARLPRLLGRFILAFGLALGGGRGNGQGGRRANGGQVPRSRLDRGIGGFELQP